MSSLMNAALFYGPGDVRFERIGIPEPGPGDVLVKIKNALTCGTDIKTYQRGHPAIIKSVPSTFGHEYSGEIVKTGRLVEHFKPGMRVVGYNSAPCQKCYYCKNNQHNLCDDLLVINGAYAEYMVIPERAVKYSLLEIPDNISFHEASLAEPLGTALHAIRLTEIKQGDTVVILGAGPLGLMLVRLAHLQGARTILVGKGDERLQKAALFGANEAIDITQFDTVESQVQEALRLTENGRGADVVIEAVGKPEVWEEALQIVRKGGKVTFFGGCKSGTRISVDTVQLHYSEITLRGVFHQTPEDFRRSLKLLSSRLVDGREFIKETVPLSELLKAFKWVKELKGIKYAIDPSVM
ncbi:MAG: zinc-dependent alcohol dehydrogenase [Dethiobacteria bacterium]|jgi:L-iditol 2-dehydrogenase